VLAVSKGSMCAKDFEGIELNLPPGTLTSAAQRTSVLKDYSETDILRLVHMNLTRNVTVGECSSQCESEEAESQINGLEYQLM